MFSKARRVAADRLKYKSRNDRIILRGELRLPVQIKTLQLYTSPQWILEEKGWLCAVRSVSSAYSPIEIISSWPYSKIVEAPYQYFTGDANSIGQTIEPLHFSSPATNLSLDFVQWSQKDDPGKTPTRIAWIGQTTDKTKLSGWIEVS